MMISHPTTCIILAGGQSRRMGQDKRRLRLWGRDGPTMLEHVLAMLTPLCHERIVVLHDAESWPGLAATLIADRQPGGGPLVGLVSGLEAMRSEQALVVAADMPSLQPALLELLLNYAFTGDALVPLRTTPTGDQPEPLLAIYRRTCLPMALACLERQQLALQQLLAQINTHYLHPSQWHTADPDARSFVNLNQLRDLSKLGLP